MPKTNSENPKTSRQILNEQKNPNNPFQGQYRRIKNEYTLPDCAHNDGRRPAAMVSGRGQENDRYIAEQAAAGQYKPPVRAAESAQSVTTNNSETKRGAGCADLLFPAIAIPALWYMCSKTPQMQLLAQKILEQLSNQ